MNGTLTDSTLSSVDSLFSKTKTRREPSYVSKIYKQASNLFLTRRLPEALSTLDLVITQPAQEFSTESSKPAPVAKANRSSRIKVWSLYLTLVNTIIELGPNDGKATFGNKVWRNITAKARDGSIWEEVVQVGYNGVEENVDVDVVINLSTLLLSQSPSQSINQQRLESYISASNQSSLDLTDRLETINDANMRSNNIDGNGTLQALASHIKILELYSLHILPRNNEMAYAKDLITSSEILDEERREAFLQALQILGDEIERDYDDERTLIREQEKNRRSEQEQAEKMTLQEAETKNEWLSEEQKVAGHKRTESEKDYGIDGSNPVSMKNKASLRAPRPMTKLTKEPPLNNTPSSSASSSQKSMTVGVYKRSLAIINALQHLISHMTQTLSRNPISLLRFVLFVTGLIVALSRRDVKERIGRITTSSWDKLKRTVGMGVKVSYI